MTEAHITALTCPSCGASLNIPEGKTRFTCGYCGNEHVLQYSVQPVAPVAPTPAPVLRPRIAIPRAVKIVKDGQSARIIQRWFSFKYIPTAFFAFVWDAFLVVWYGITLGTHAPWIFSVFPLIHVAIGIGITYYTVVGCVNSTTLELTRDELRIYFDPLPWPGEKTIPTRDIKQLYCKETLNRSKNGASVSYELRAITQDDHQIKLLSKLDSLDIAQFFEQQLETWLKITDQPVLNEYQ